MNDIIIEEAGKKPFSIPFTERVANEALLKLVDRSNNPNAPSLKASMWDVIKTLESMHKRL